MCSLSYPARNGHALYYIVTRGLSGSTVYFHIISQMPRLKKKLNKQSEFLFSLNLLSETFLIVRRTERDMTRNVYWYCQILMKLEFSRQVFEKYSNTKRHENPSSGGQTVSCGRTDGRIYRQTNRHGEANRRFSQFCEGA